MSGRSFAVPSLVGFLIVAGQVPLSALLALVWVDGRFALPCSPCDRHRLGWCGVARFTGAAGGVGDHGVSLVS